MPNARPKLGNLLVDLGFISEEQLETALGYQRQHGGRIGKILVESAVITEDRLVHVLARQLGMDTCDPLSTQVHPRVLELLSAELAYRHRMLPLARKKEGDGQVVFVALADPLDTTAIEAVRHSLGANVRVHWMLSGDTEIEVALNKHYGPPPPGIGTPGPPTSGPHPAATYQGVPVVQGLPFRQDLPPRREAPNVAPPAKPPPAAPPSAERPFQPLAPGEELSATGSIEEAFQGAFSSPELGETEEPEVPPGALDALDDDPFREGPEDPPRLPTADLEVVSDDEFEVDDGADPIPLERVAPPDAGAAFEASTDSDPLPTDGEVVEVDDPDDVPDVSSPGIRETQELGGLPALGPLPSQDLEPAAVEDDAPMPVVQDPLSSGSERANEESAGQVASEDRPEASSAPRAEVGPPATTTEPTWGDLLSEEPSITSSQSIPSSDLAPIEQPSEAAEVEASLTSAEVARQEDLLSEPEPEPEPEPSPDDEADVLEVDAADLEEFETPPPSGDASLVVSPPSAEPELGPAQRSTASLDVDASRPTDSVDVRKPTTLEALVNAETIPPEPRDGAPVQGNAQTESVARTEGDAPEDLSELQGHVAVEGDETTGSESAPALRSPFAAGEATGGMEPWMEASQTLPPSEPLHRADVPHLSDDLEDASLRGRAPLPDVFEPTPDPRVVSEVPTDDVQPERRRLERFLRGEPTDRPLEAWVRLALLLLKEAELLDDDRLERALSSLEGD